MKFDNGKYFISEQTESAIGQLTEQISFFYDNLKITDEAVKADITTNYANVLFEIIFVGNMRQDE